MYSFVFCKSLNKCENFMFAYGLPTRNFELSVAKLPL